ncbi:DUF6339 family protein [Altibacter sp. HG106]|uniref:DUF6339 family protein n=1 Tax=Altibacter sp. HG106 TaxID=3023937 RepID=UPI0023502D07|nr:DUF6339 family protein [Altibacter sp. HG106]MDC7993538.1 DUF6339 family protein [Altibacter sp. HG106]
MKIQESHIEQKIFSSGYLNHIYLQVFDNKKFSHYEQMEFPLEKENVHPNGGSRIYVPNNITLAIPEGNKGADLKEIENTKIIYEAFRTLTPTQASDPRLWTYLTHVTFWEYMRKRWPVAELQKDKKKNYIKERYLLTTTNLRTLTHNGISRLWWFGYLTYDENRENPWELTETLLKGTDLPTSLLERAIGTNKNIRTGVLEFFSENPSLITSKSVQEILKMLNLVGGVKNLPFLESNEIKEIMNELKNVA